MTNDTTRSLGDKVSTDYAKLKDVLDHAYNQAARGKGKARHANDKPFDRQPILEIGRMVGTGYATGQIMKKAQEAHGMVARGEHEAAVAELLGVIVYAASAVVLVKELSDEARASSAITLPRATPSSLAALQAVSTAVAPLTERPKAPAGVLPARE
jgi:hypothetical protein